MTVTTATDVPAAWQIDDHDDGVASANPSVDGELVTFTATVSPVPNGGPAFTDGGGSPSRSTVARSVAGTVERRRGSRSRPAPLSLTVGDAHRDGVVRRHDDLQAEHRRRPRERRSARSVERRRSRRRRTVDFGQPVTFTEHGVRGAADRNPTAPLGTGGVLATVRRCSAA